MQLQVKTVKITLAIISSFITFWTPYFVVHLIHIWSEYEYRMPKPVFVFADTLALANSAVNPLIYGCFNLRLAHRLFSLLVKSPSPPDRHLTSFSNSRSPSSIRNSSLLTSRQMSLDSRRTSSIRRIKRYHNTSSTSDVRDVDNDLILPATTTVAATVAPAASATTAATTVAAATATITTSCKPNTAITFSHNITIVIDPPQDDS